MKFAMDVLEFVGKLIIWIVMILTMVCISIFMIAFTVEALWYVVTKTKVGF